MARDSARESGAPIDPWTVQLDAELLAATERVARHVHDAWMRARLAEGWTYGRQRDDARRVNPCLVGYDALSETDREADRVTAMAAMRALIALGFEIRRMAPPRADDRPAGADQQQR
jgi:hypothetical protein